MMRNYFFPMCSFLVCVSVSSTVFSGAGASMFARVDDFLFPEEDDEVFKRKFAEYQSPTPSPGPTNLIEAKPANQELSCVSSHPAVADDVPEVTTFDLDPLPANIVAAEVDSENGSTFCNLGEAEAALNPVNNAEIRNPMFEVPL